MSTYAINKRGTFDYELLDRFEAGIVLAGHEVKAVRNGLMSLKGSYVTVGTRGATLLNAHIGAYPKAGTLADYDPTRSRKLLLHKREIIELVGKIKQKGLTLIPVKVYTSHDRIKLEFAIGRGRKQFDKRTVIKEREWQKRKHQTLKR